MAYVSLERKQFLALLRNEYVSLKAVIQRHAVLSRSIFIYFISFHLSRLLESSDMK
jgi:hypothetical protein